MEFIQNVFVQFGALGLLLAIILWYSFYQMKFTMTQLKENHEVTKKRLDNLIQENKKIESEFRQYLMGNSKEQINIIKENTLAINRVLDFFNKNDIKNK